MTSQTSVPGRRYRYYDLLMAGFVAVLLCSNLIGPAKVAEVTLPFSLPVIGAVLVFGAGNIFFPISYIFGDVLTEVYGYARARKVIWAGFGAMIFATVMAWVVIRLPVSPSEPFNQVLQPAIETVFGNTWRIVVASIAAFWVGDFVNAYVMAKMKVWTRGRHLWTRTIGSTILGQGIDSLIFYPIAFGGIWEHQTLIAVLLFNWAFKVTVEVVATPATYLVVGYLKRAENEDVYDSDTDFTPFSLRD
ncbi:MAG: queuosine precursor transporter [Xanthomonadales bacterium]|nr:queuosine precursor transporter [Xanthomonadales bacterium]